MTLPILPECVFVKKQMWSRMFKINIQRWRSNAHLSDVCSVFFDFFYVFSICCNKINLYNTK